MTEKELINRAKIFQGNRLLDGDRVKIADCIKIILLSQLVDGSIEIKEKAMIEFLQKIRKKYAWQYWFF